MADKDSGEASVFDNEPGSSGNPAVAFTPGPWVAAVAAGRIASVPVKAGRRSIASVWKRESGRLNVTADSASCGYANARLIAAAPELYEALEDIVQQYEASRVSVGADLSDSIRIFGKRALAKARGEAP